MASRAFFEISVWRLDEQLSQIRELNSRLAGVFTAATALLVLFAAFQDFEGIEHPLSSPFSAVAAYATRCWWW